MAKERIKVTVLSGFLGSGKTTVVDHLLRNNKSRRIALIVNDMGEINIDAQLLKSASATKAEGLIELTNGCICCTLRDDMVEQLAELARSGKYDYIVVESTGIGEPLPVAAGFTKTVVTKGKKEKQLKEIVDLDTMVTVVDGANFDRYMKEYSRAGDVFPCKKEGDEGHEHQADPEEDKGVVDLLVQQIEFADVIIVNKADTLDKDGAQRISTICKRMNPSAEVIVTTRGKVDPEKVLGTGRFCFEKATELPEWVMELSKGHVPETEEYGISSFRWTQHRPFHPVRFHALLTSKRLATEYNVLRSKGFLWLFTPVGNMHQAGFSMAGGLWEIGMRDPWLCTIPRKQLEMELAEQGLTIDVVRKQHSSWDDRRIGDRCTDLVVIGQRMERSKVEKELEDCLVTDEEWKQGVCEEDPFVVEEMMEEDEEGEELEEEEEEEEEEAVEKKEEQQETGGKAKKRSRSSEKPSATSRRKVA